MKKIGKFFKIFLKKDPLLEKTVFCIFVLLALYVLIMETFFPSFRLIFPATIDRQYFSIMFLLVAILYYLILFKKK